MGILSSTNASSEAGSLGYIICSEQLFTESIGAASYAAVAIQLAGSSTDETVSVIRGLLPSDVSIADKWGTTWQLPAVSLLLIVVLCFGSAALAIRRPIKKIGKLSIVDTIKLQQ